MGTESHTIPETTQQHFSTDIPTPPTLRTYTAPPKTLNQKGDLSPQKYSHSITKKVPSSLAHQKRRNSLCSSFPACSVQCKLTIKNNSKYVPITPINKAEKTPRTYTPSDLPLHLQHVHNSTPCVPHLPRYPLGVRTRSTSTIQGAAFELLKRSSQPKAANLRRLKWQKRALFRTGAVCRIFSGSASLDYFSGVFFVFAFSSFTSFELGTFFCSLAGGGAFFGSAAGAAIFL